MNSFWGLLHSAMMLLALCFVYDTFGVYAISNKRLRDCISGILVGLIGVSVMLAPWTLRPGVFFDTRWILLSLSGLFFGFTTTSIAVIITGSFRLYQGGPGGVVGTVVIVVTACVGLAWKYWSRGHSKPFGWKQLYAFGVLVQIAMLSCMLLMPAEMRIPIIKAVAPTILLIYPVITMFIGLILERQETRRNAEVELIENRKALIRERGLLRGVIDSIPDLIFFKNTKGEFLGCNKSFEAFTGLEEQSILGKTNSDLYGTDRANCFLQHEEKLSNEESTKNEEWVVFADGKSALLDTLETQFKGLDGTLHGLVGISRDITERKQAEELVKRSRNFLQTVIDGFPEMLIVINTDYSIALANKPAGMLVGKSHSDLLGLPCFMVSQNLKEPCQGENRMCPLQEVIESKASVTVEHIRYDATGKKRNIELVAAPIFDDKGEVVQIIESCRDITDRRAAEDAKLNLERQVQHAQKLESLGVLAGGIAHDFNNILMGVLGNAELAMMKLSPENPANDYIKSIGTAAIRATDLAKQMLAYSGKGQFVVEPLNVNNMVKEMLELLKTTISKTVSLKLHLSENTPTTRGDITQVRQVLMNLITNASEAIGDSNGEITVSTGVVEVAKGYLNSAFSNKDVAEGCYAFVEVIDTGCGMDSETQTRMFDPFFTTKFTGRGLGMAATLGIIQGHKGAIEIFSEPGKGTTVKVLLPSSDGSIESERTSVCDKGSLRAEQWQGGGTILVVDDEQSVRDITREVLTDQGFNVLVAKDGREGLEIFEEHPDVIDLVLLDMTMPRMGGAETFREMRKIRPDVPVVLSSGYNEYEATNVFSEQGLAGFIQKPYRSSALVGKLRELLGKWRNLDLLNK